MNERITKIAASSLIIKQLAKQAEEYADIEYNASDLDWYELKEEKFAELIVKECCHIMNTTAKKAEESNTYMGDDVPTRVHQYKIKQHFGVEE